MRFRILLLDLPVSVPIFFLQPNLGITTFSNLPLVIPKLFFAQFRTITLKKTLEGESIFNLIFQYILKLPDYIHDLTNGNLCKNSIVNGLQTCKSPTII